MKSAIKKQFAIGKQIVMVHSAQPSRQWMEIDKNKRIGEIRTIKKVQTNAIEFSDSSWLYYPPANDTEKTEKGFIVRYPDGWYLEYEFLPDTIKK